MNRDDFVWFHPLPREAGLGSDAKSMIGSFGRILAATGLNRRVSWKNSGRVAVHLHYASEDHKVSTNPRLVSFDVFDTLLTRAVGSPTGFLFLYARAAGLILPACISSLSLLQTRRAAEDACRARVASGEVKLDEIYSELRYRLSLTQAQQSALMDLELSMEELFLRSVPRAVGELRSIAQAGGRVVAISDMYLSEEFVKRQLRRFGLDQYINKCYVSCEYGRSKRNGDLFECVVRDNCEVPVVVHHIGNDAIADVKVPRSVGIRATEWSEGNLNRFEVLLERHTATTDGFASCLAGASRLARLTVAAADTPTRALRDVTAGVVAPTLTAYVLWLLRRARERSISQLFFVSRDGQILLDVARRLQERLGRWCACRYLYGSRQAWHQAACDRVDEGHLSWILDRTTSLCVRVAFSRLGLDPVAFSDLLREKGFQMKEWDSPLGDAHIARLREVLMLPEVQHSLSTTIELKRELLKGYLRQEEVSRRGSWALVDLGWYGRLQSSLWKAAGDDLGGGLIGFYFGLRATDQQLGPIEMESYYYDLRSQHGWIGRIPHLEALMEVFCSADHGGVLGYEQCAGRFVPILSSPSNALPIAWGLPIVRQTIAAFCDHLVLDAHFTNPWAELRPAITDVLHEFAAAPTADEATAWGSFPFEEQQGLLYSKPLAEQYHFRDVLHAAATGRIKPHHLCSWHQGSLALTSRETRLALIGSMKARRLARYTMNRVCSLSASAKQYLSRIG